MGATRMLNSRIRALLALSIFSVSIATSSSANVTFECTQGWDLIGTHCYYFVKTQLDFEDAVDVCDTFGAKLLIVRDEVEARNVSSVAGSRFTTDHYWIYNGKVATLKVDVKAFNSIPRPVMDLCGSDSNDKYVQSITFSNGQDAKNSSLNSTYCEGMWQPNEPRETTEDVAIASSIQGRWALKWTWTNLPFVCRAPACPTGSFRCSDGACLNRKWKCDGAFDCQDYSDESDCTDNVKYNRSSSGNLDTNATADSGYYEWILEGQPGEVLKLEIGTLIIEDNVDSVRVYTGGASIFRSELIQEMKRSLTEPVTIFGKNHFLIVVIESDATTFKPTFKASWTSDSQVSMKQIEIVTVTDAPKSISSPYFSSPLLPRSFKMEWLLLAPEGQLITLEVLNNTFDMNAGLDVFIVTNVGFVLMELTSKKTIYVSSKNTMSVIIKAKTGKRVFSARFRTGCDFTTMLSSATFSLMNLPKNLNCSWTFMNEMGTDLRLRIDKVYFDDSNDFLQLSMGTAMSMVFATLNSSNAGAREFDSLSSQVSFKYFSDNVRPGNMIMGRILADCPNIRNMSNMNVTYSNTSDVGKSYKAYIICQEGFSFKQEEYRSNTSLSASCNEGGMWDWGSPSYTRMPECQIVYCGFPPQIRNGFVNEIAGNIKYKGIASYQCFAGFQIKGSSNVTCEANGIWSQVPTCEAEKCPAVQNVLNASYNFTYGNQSDVGYGTVVKYVCEPGYDLVGAQTIVCLINKTWSHTSPSCRKLTCPLPMINHGRYSSMKLPQFQETVSLSCDSGYQINRTKTQSDNSIICGANRILSFANDVCIDIDECSGNLNNCSLATEDCINKEGSFSCVCKSGYNGTGCQDIDECALGICDQKCANSPGSYICSCQNGYTLYTVNGTNGFYIQSGEDGLRSGDVFEINNTCVPVSCKNEPEIPAHGKALKTKSSYFYNETVKVICNFGYVLEGSSLATCQSNGNWTYTSTPICKNLTCKQPAIGAFEAYRVPSTSGDLEPEASLIISCNLNDGSGKSVNKTLFCAPSPGDSGKFILQGDDPKCPEINCGSPLNIPGTNQGNVSQTLYGSSFEFSCDNNRGFKLVGLSALGNYTVVCQSNGRWGYANLTCEGSRCKDPGTMGGTIQIVKTSYEIDQVVLYNCTRPGFTPSSNNSLVCDYKNGNAIWSAAPPMCEDTTPPMIMCPSLEPFDLYSSLVYPSPYVTDNSGLSCFMIASGPPSGVSVVSANVTVKYRATDTKKEAFCEFNVTLKDYTEPTIECNATVQRDLAGNKYEILNLTAALLKSHSGDGVIKFSPESPINITVGSYVPVRANITKANGLVKECAFLVVAVSTMCMNDSITAPANGRIDKCTGNNSSMTCTTVCNDGYLYQNTLNSTSYSCTNGVWSAKLPLQPCIKLSKPTFDFDVKLLYIMSGAKVPITPNYDSTICLERHYIKLAQLVQGMSVCGYSNYTAINIRRYSESSSTADFISFTLQLFISDGNETSLENCNATMLNQSVSLFGPTDPSFGSTTCLSPWSVSPSNGTITAKSMTCDNLSTMIDYNNKRYCLPCGPGMFFNIAAQKCQECQDGSYQGEEGKTECKPCPAGVLKSNLPRTSNSHCLELCPQGFMSTSGYTVDNCMACPSNQFSKLPNSCLSCPNNGSTLGVSGAISESQCSEPCPPGQYSLTGYMPCSPCPLNFYSDVSAAKICKECSSSTYTTTNGSSSTTNCISGGSLCTATFCNAAGIMPNSVCEIRDHRPVCTCKQGYYGDACNSSCDVCRTNPCYNDGVCTAYDGLNFNCTCKTETTCVFDKNIYIRYTSNSSEASSSAATLNECREKCFQNTGCKAFLVEKGTICYLYNSVLVNTDPNDNHDSYVKNCTVKQLFDGTFCERDLINDCNDTVCTSLNFCMDLVGGTKCQCPQDGNYDSKCAKPENPCQGNNCSGHGTCIPSGSVRSVCVCQPGYTGIKCENDTDECAINKYGCLYNGTCQNGNDTYSCSCINGFSGPHCEKMANFCASNDCKVADGGICTNDFQNLTASCTCGEDYMPDPQKLNSCVKMNYCMSNPCLNGTCVGVSGGFKCDCLSGFRGSLCQHNIDNCANQTCQNGGSCMDMVNNYTCQCPTGFSGLNCEVNINDCTGSCVTANIENTCIDLIADYRCPCKPAFKGKNCSEDVDECTVREPCLHGSNCSNQNGSYNCACPTGWTGSNCEQENNYCSSSPCKNMGKCHNLLEQYYCQCQDGTAGRNCEQMEQLCEKFRGSVCSVDGKCELAGGTAQCQCLGDSACTFFAYPSLDYTTNSTFVDYSTNTQSECQDLCLKNVNCVAYLFETGTNNCYQYKTLLTGTGASPTYPSYLKNCKVKPYYSGVACELQKNQCADNPCNGGICTLSNLTYVCDCSVVKNYVGKNCNEKKDVCNICPKNVPCKEYLDQEGYLRPACICPANGILSGNDCKSINRDYDLAFLEHFAQKRKFVTSERGFYLEMNTSLTVALWVAAAKKLDNNTFILALKSPKSKDPFLSLFNSKVELTNNQTASIDLIQDDGLKHNMDESFLWHFISIAWSASGTVEIVFDFVTLKKTVISVVPPMNEVVFVHLGQSFYGYISQVSVWSTALTSTDSFQIYGNKLAAVQVNSLLLGWTLYSFDDSVQRTKSSTAASSLSICAIPNTIAKVGLDSPDCKNKVFPVKTPPKFNLCNSSVVVPTDYSIHQVSSSILGYAIAKPDEFKPENQFFSYGAYDVAISLKDTEGNIGVCMMRAFITPNKCSSTEPQQGYTQSCPDSSNGRKVTCPVGQMPSVPVPNFIMCSKLQTFNLDNMYEQPDRIICGERKPRSLLVKLLLPYSIQVNCENNVLTSFNSSIKNKIKELNNSWPGLCSNTNCDNVIVNSSCNDSRTVNVQVQISSLGEYLNSSIGMWSYTPQDLMIKTVAEETPLEVPNIAGAKFTKINATINSFPSCDMGYSLMGVLCVQCGPGSYYHEGEMKCKLCDLNKYTLQPGNTTCTDCPPNQITFQRGSSNTNDCKEKCPQGQMYSTITNKCVPCPKNFYQDQEGKSYCVPCQPASGTENNGSKSLADCKAFCEPGTELKDQKCVKCQRGFYRLGNLQDPCTQCPLSNFTTRDNGTIYEKDCNIPKCAPGEYVQGNVSFTCQPCDYGSYQPNEAEFKCLPCNVNFTTENKGATNVSSCRFVCPIGHEENTPGSYNCVPCKRGFYRSGDLDQRFANCTMCMSGITTVRDGSTNKTDCQISMCMAGMYLNVTENKCFNCSSNFYQNETQQVDCKACPNNFQTKVDGATSLDNCTFVCSPGYEVNSTDKSCTLCPRGTYKDASLKFESCKNCSLDKTTDNPGAMDLAMCNVAKCMKGYNVSADNTTCVKCPKGTYQAMDMPMSTTVCVLCPQNTSTQIEASISISDCKVACEPGFGISNGKCEPCQQGSWNNGNSTLKFVDCQMCPMNFTTNVLEKATDVANCTIRNCPLGTYINSTTNDCTPCEIGFYQNQSIQTSCIKCPIKTSTNSTGSKSLTDCTINCPPEESGETGVCVRCPDDRFKNSSGFGQCLNCTGDFTSTPAIRSSCTEMFCDNGRELKDGNCTDCQFGFYKPSRGNIKCLQCPGNTTTSRRQSTSATDCSITFCNPGFYSADNTTCTVCPSSFFKNESGNQNCTECPKGITTDGSGKNSSSDCYIKFCLKGQFRNSTNQCQACGIGSYQNLEGQSSCKTCSTNYTTLQTGTVDENECRIVCQAGSYRNDSVNSCFLCPRGTYQELPGKNECTPCMMNYTTASEGSIRQNQCYVSCAQGYYRNGTSPCVPCPVGQYQNESDQESCKKCGTIQQYTVSTLSTASKKETDCYPVCSQGVYLNVTSRSCELCPVGSYKSQTNLDMSCQQCSNGLTTERKGETSSAGCTVKLCGRGFYREQNSSNCILCPVGKFQSSNTSGNIFECTPCPDSKTTLIEGAPADTLCIMNCSMGEEYKIRNKRCTKCPLGQYRPMTSTAPPTCFYCPNGFTTLSRGQSSCIPSSSASVPNLKISVSVIATFKVQECANLQAIRIAIKQIMIKLVEIQNKRYNGLCSGRCDSSVNFIILKVCGDTTREKRQADQTAQANVTASYVDAVLSDGTRVRPSVGVLEGAFYNTDAVAEELATYKLSLESVAAQEPGSVYAIDAEGNPEYCKSGQFCGTNKCESCPKGTYSTDPITKTCITCPNGQTTEKSGAGNFTSCNGECEFNTSYCGQKGTCKRNTNGISFCECSEGYTDVACSMRMSPEETNIQLVIGICVGIGAFLMLLLLIFACCAYKKKQASKKAARKLQDKRSLGSESEGYDFKYPVFNQPMMWADPTMYGREVVEM